MIKKTTEFKKAIKAIRKEVKQNKGDGVVYLIAEFLKRVLDEHPEHAGKITAEGKNISAAIKEINNAAVQSDAGDYAAVRIDTAMNIALKHFGIPEMNTKEINDMFKRTH